ncbi:MAG: Hpt domain-containing protein [Bacteroidia bacterium]
MIKNDSEKKNGNVCNLNYLSETMGGKKSLIKEIMNVFLKQVPEELQFINDAITKTDYKTIKSYAHTMKSTVSIMGISTLTPILQKMEDLGARAADIEEIIEMNKKLTAICKQAMEEIEREEHNYE